MSEIWWGETYILILFKLHVAGGPVTNGLSSRPQAELFLHVLFISNQMLGS
jgi:hypothetical protein